MARNPKPIRKSHRAHRSLWRYWLSQARLKAAIFGRESEVADLFASFRDEHKFSPYKCYFFSLSEWEIDPYATEDELRSELDYIRVMLEKAQDDIKCGRMIPWEDALVLLGMSDDDTDALLGDE